jgi:hypothetical protein
MKEVILSSRYVSVEYDDDEPFHLYYVNVDNVSGISESKDKAKSLMLNEVDSLIEDLLRVRRELMEKKQ